MRDSAGPDEVIAEVKGADNPGFLDHVRNLRRKHRRPVVTAFEFLHRAGQLFGDVCDIHVVVPQHAGEIRIRRFQKLHKEVFHFDVEVRLRDAKLRRRFEGLPAREAELRN